MFNPPVIGIPVSGIFDSNITGAFEFEESERGLFYICPCGCGQHGYIGFRGKTEPERPSWIWDGNREKPTLSPSIQKTSGCKTHCHLINGIWTN